MSTLRLVERSFAPGRSWYSLVDVVTDRVVRGGMRSETEAEQWATGEGHTLANPPARKSGATKTGPSSPPPEGSPRAASIVAPGPSSGIPSPDRSRGGEVQSGSPSAATPSRGRPLARPAILKDDAPCCVVRRDALGRMPIGWCSRECVRRPRVRP